ncbi:hypothetical protein Dthio_PD3062 [Desulfonatronospira thiodismutans ASO3-1]|uniref:Uncharacterized protein n=1 Tax=Desulfonatronospira thiodismutans ASO3-1 TaxID=555779 RepID=D6SLS2_9BACT|nr:hypothetical protein Dthio_PD3062 [Desulfonatronospira thiodismutans ASO3-1]
MKFSPIQVIVPVKITKPSKLLIWRLYQCLQVDDIGFQGNYF